MRRLGWIVLLAVCCAPLLVATPAAAQNGYRNVVNEPYATVADGPLGGVVVDVADPDRPVERHRALRGPSGRGERRQAPPWFRMLQAQGLLPDDHPLPILPQTVVQRHGGELVLPNTTRASGRQSNLGNPANRLSFVYGPGEGDTAGTAWSTGQRDAIAAFLADIEDDLLRVYGPPAYPDTVRIVHDPSLNATNMVAYDASRKEIRIELLNDIDHDDPAATPLDDYDLYVLTYAVLRAYRGEAFLFYDAWEDGMVRAAQLLVISVARPSFGFLRRDLNLMFRAYDLLNQPGLEGPSFLGTGSGNDAIVLREALATIRAYLAQAAWLKVYAENNDVFARFNQAYYQRLAAGSSISGVPLAGHVPMLKSLVRPIVPTVEGLRFDDWYRRQHVLDTSLIPGAKLYVFAIPDKDFFTGEPTNSLPMNVYHFRMTPAGEQQPLAGRVHFDYTAYDDFDLNAAVEGASGASALQADLGAAGNPAGLASAIPLFFNIAGDQGVQQQRIVVDVQVNGMDRTLYYAYDVAVDDSRAPNQIYGVVTNGRQGTLTVAIEGIAEPLEIDVIQGAFRAKLPSGLPAPATATFTWTPEGTEFSQAAERQSNIMYLGLIGAAPDAEYGDTILVIDTPPEQLSRITRAIPQGLRMVTIPAYASRGNAAEVLGVPAEQLLLARADGAVPGAEPYRLDSIYALWPNTAAFRPGYAYWVLAREDLQLEFDGVEANRDRPFRQHFPPGWQQFGNPYTDLNLRVGDLRVQPVDDGPLLSLAEAQTQGVVSSGVFRYNTAQGGYELVDADTVLQPYEGFWINILADRGATLVFPNALGAGRSALRPTSRRAGDANDWRVQLVAQTEGHTDRANAFGVSRGAGNGWTNADIMKPPPFGPFVSVSFVEPSGADSRYAVDLRESDGATKQWDVLVETNLTNQPVTLTWPELAGVPGDVSLQLTDLTSGEQRFMRTTGSYTFQAGPQGAARRLRVTAERGGSAGLAVLGLNVQPTRAGGSVQFTLSAPAEVTVQLMSQGGRLLRTLAHGRAASRGTSQVAFRPVDEQGRPLPRGVYRVDLIAVGPDGRQARATRLVRVER